MDNLKHLIRYESKAASWAAPMITHPTVLAAAAKLPVIKVTTKYPVNMIMPNPPQFFVAERPNGQRFLVDTQGYNYARYIAALPGAPGAAVEPAAPNGNALAEFCEGEQIADLIDLAAMVAASNLLKDSTIGKKAVAILTEILARQKAGRQ